MNTEQKVEYICKYVNTLDNIKLQNISKLLVHSLDNNVLIKNSSESADGTRIFIENFSNIEGYDILINNIYNFYIN